MRTFICSADTFGNCSYFLLNCEYCHELFLQRMERVSSFSAFGFSGLDVLIQYVSCLTCFLFFDFVFVFVFVFVFLTFY